MSHIVRSAKHIKDTKSSSRLILVKLLFRLVILGIWLCYYVQKFLPCLNNNFVYDIVCQKILVYWEALEKKKVNIWSVFENMYFTCFSDLKNVTYFLRFLKWRVIKSLAKV